MNDWDTMIAELATIPDLPGAQCRGHWELFDAATPTTKGPPPRRVEQARQAATDLCAQCPALNPCQSWLDTLPADQRPYGVVAGRIITPTEPSGRDGPSSFQRDLATRAERFAELHATGMSFRAIAAATGSSEPSVRRTLTQPPTTERSAP